MYIIEYEENQYYLGVGKVTEDIEKAKTYTKGDLPDAIGNRMLYRIGTTPENWKYVSTCNEVSCILKK